MKTLKNDVILYFTLCYEPSQSVFDKVGVLDKCDVSSYTEYIKNVSEYSKLVKDFAEIIDYINRFKNSVTCKVSFNKLATEQPYFNNETDTIENIPLLNVSIKDIEFGVAELIQHIKDWFDQEIEYFTDLDFREYETDKNILDISQSLSIVFDHSITIKNVTTMNLLEEIEHRNFNMDKPNIKINKDIEDVAINDNITSLNNKLAQFNRDLEKIVGVMLDNRFINPNKTYDKEMINRTKNDYNKITVYKWIMDISNLLHGTGKTAYYDVSYNANYEITSICLVAVEEEE
nr:MAG TPA: hypothetical protein [Caudoviricetes sp.]